MQRITAIGVGFLVSIATGFAAEQKTTPGWIKNDPAKKATTLDIVSGWNPDNGALNFNGYSNDQATIVVPVNWTVRVNFVNHDGMLPHSMLVTKPYAKDAIPPQAGVSEVAISKAYSRDPESGIGPNEKDNFSFVPHNAGDYWVFCGVPGHGVQGMYIGFKVDPAADQAYLLRASDAPAGRE